MSAEPSSIRYTEDHEWVRREADGSVVIGITDHAQEQLGDIVFVQLPEVGTHFDAGDEAAVIESVKAAGGINMPLAGTVVEVNPALGDTPGTVNAEPLGAGWFFRFTPDDAAAFDALLDAAAYAAVLGG